MAMKPSTRNFLISTLLGLGALALAAWQVGRLFFRIGMFGPDRTVQTQTLTLLACFFGPIVVLGVLVAWIGFLRDGRERARRGPPLSLE